MPAVLPSGAEACSSVSAVQNIKVAIQSQTTLRLVISPVQKLKQQLENLSGYDSEIIADIHNLSEEDLNEVRLLVKIESAKNWIVECACDAEIWVRHSKFKSAPGRSDIGGVGLTSAIAKRAKSFGCSPKTIRLNARIFTEFNGRLNNTVQTLPDKGFYQAALKHSDPQEALDSFIEHKFSQPKFNPAAAERLITELRRVAEEEKQVFIQNNFSEKEKELRRHIIHAIAEIRKLKGLCPDESFKDQFYEDFLQDLQDHLDMMFDTKAAIIFREAWAKGHRKIKEITDYTGLSNAEVEHVIIQLKIGGEQYESIF